MLYFSKRYFKLKIQGKDEISFTALLAIIITIFPFYLSEKISVGKINHPVYSEEFGTVFPFISFLSIISIVIFFLKILQGGCINIKLSYIIIYVLINIFSITLASYTVPNLYLDSVVLLINSISIALIWSLIDKNNRYIGLILSIFLSCTVAIFIQLVGLSEKDRLSIPGFEITSSGYAAGLMILLALEYMRTPQRILIIITGLYVIILTGSRFPLLLLIFVMALRFISKNLKFKKIYYLPGVFIIIYVTINALLNVRDDLSNYSISLLIQDFIDAVDIYNPNMPIQNDQISRINTIFGRVVGLLSGIDLIKINFPSPLASDWAIQDNLIDRGFPSHTHSTLVQYILKYGLFSIPIFLIAIRNYIRQIKTADSRRWAYLYLLLSTLVDYIFFIPSIVAFFLLLASEEKQKNSGCV